MRWLRTTGAVLLLLGAAGCAALPPLAPAPAETPGRFVAHTTRQGDTITTDYRTDDIKVWITSEKGIGRATFERTGAPARSLTFYLRLKGLEEFTLAWDGVTVTGHYPSSGGAARADLVRGGEQSEPIAPPSPHYAPVRIEAENPTVPLQDGYFVITAPPAFLQDAPEQFALTWIDFYR